MKKIELIELKINQLPKGESFGVSSLVGVGSYENVRQVLSRLVRVGKLKRVTRGVYVRPEKELLRCQTWTLNQIFTIKQYSELLICPHRISTLQNALEQSSHSHHNF